MKIKTILIVVICFMACALTLGLNERLTGYTIYNGERISNIEYAFSQVETSDTSKDDLVLLALFGTITQAKEQSTYEDNGVTQIGDAVLVAVPVTDSSGNNVGGIIIVSWNDYTRPSTAVNGSGETVTIPYTPSQERFELSSYSVAQYYAKVLRPFAYPEPFPEFDSTLTDPVWSYLDQLVGYASWFGSATLSIIALVFTFLFDLVLMGIDVVRWAFWLIGF